MKRKRICPVEPQHGACGVWLDASALKKRKVQTVMPLRVLNRRAPSFPPTRSSLPCTKQTTISTFFSVLQEGERRARTSQRVPLGASSDASFPKDHALEKQPQDLCCPQPASAPAQSEARWEDAVVEEEALLEGKDFLSFDCRQPLPEKGLLEQTKCALSPLRERNLVQDSRPSRNRQPFPQVAVQAEARQRLLPSRSDGCLTEATELENVDPHLKGRSSNQPISGLCARPSGEVCKSSYDKGQQESQAELPVAWFSQDSEGHRVISHRLAPERGRLPLHRKPLWNQSSPRAGWSDTSQHVPYDALFTEDSEGNRVIKH